MENSPVLKSWKEISAFLRVTVRTAQRWERDRGLPVHRTRAEKGSAVLGFREEIQTWLQTRPAGEMLLDDSNANAPRQEQSSTSTCGGTLVTELLWRRPSRPADLSKEIEVLRQLAPQVANQDPERVLNDLVTHAMELCKADSAGVSLTDLDNSGQAIFRWVAAAGKMKSHLGGTTPRNFSPCGVCLERNAAQLFSYPERFFAYLQDLVLPMTELLLIPFYADHQSFGTLWVFSHDTQRKFDREDVRILTSLADVAGAALRVMRLQQPKKQGEERAAADFEAMTLLYEIGNRSGRRDSNLEECLDAIVEAAIAITRANKGNLQLFNPTLGGFTIAAKRGFEDPFLKFFALVPAGDSTCSMGERVVVEDVTQSEIFVGKPSLDVLLTADIRAVQSMPMISSSGKVVGMISTHFREPHRPDERELRFMNLLARQAADYVERKQSEDAAPPPC
jgi:GAF domain-containing protein